MSITRRWCLFSLSLLAVAACGGSQGVTASAKRGSEEPLAKPVAPKPGPVAPKPGPDGTLAETTIETSARRKAVSSRPILDHLPSDRSIIVHMSWHLIEASPVYQQHGELLTNSVKTQVGYVIDTCGFDPMDELESLTLALGSDPQNNDDMIFAATLRIGRSQVEDCIRRTGGTIEEGKYIVKGDAVNFHWTDESTLLIADKMNATEMQKALAKGRATSTESIMQFLRKTDSHAAIWGGGVLPLSMASTMVGSGIPMPRGFHFSQNAGSGIDSAIGLVFNNDAEATAALATFRTGMSMLGSQMAWGVDLAKAIQMRQAANNVAIDIIFTAQEFAKLVDASK